MISQAGSLLHTGPAHLLEASFKEQILEWTSHRIRVVITAAEKKKEKNLSSKLINANLILSSGKSSFDHIQWFQMIFL